MHPQITVGLGTGLLCSSGARLKFILGIEVHLRYFYCRSMNPKPFRAAWDPSALQSLSSLLPLPGMPDTHMGGRLLDLGAQLVGVGEVPPSCRRCFSRLGSERFPLAPRPGHVRGGRLPTRVAQTHFRAASRCLPTYLQLGELKLLFLVICKKKKSLSGWSCLCFY